MDTMNCFGSPEASQSCFAMHQSDKASFIYCTFMPPTAGVEPEFYSSEYHEARVVAATLRKILAYQWQHSAGEVGLAWFKG